MRFYLVRHAYFSQVEAWAIVGLRFGYTAFGLAVWPPRKARNGRKVPWWVPNLRLDFWAHTGQCDQRWLFRFRCYGRYLGYRTRGDATPNLDRYYDAGWHTS